MNMQPDIVNSKAGTNFTETFANFFTQECGTYPLASSVYNSGPSARIPYEQASEEGALLTVS